jgi:lysophospholipase L1-like esterase
MLAALVALAFAPPAEPLALNDGDRVVWLGGTLIEREQRYGRWEEAVTLFNHPKKVTFRNLGWSGDTVYGDARAGFDDAKKGYERLVSLTRELNPTVIVICYGANESFDGEAGLDRFRKGLAKLLDDLASTKARLVLMSPIPAEPSKALTDVSARNAMLAKYVGVIADTAEKRGLGYIDLFGRTLNRSGRRITENGLHPADRGYFELTRDLYSPPILSRDVPELRAKIVAKNELFFHRWRPQNETYLFGFRKHEQGKNAKEVAEFDPLVTTAEKEIEAILKAIPPQPSRP